MIQEIFQMAAEEDAKLLKPHKISDIQQLEDDLASVSADLRDIRATMAAKGIEEVKLMSGTFRLRLNELMENAKTFQAAVSKQIIRQRLSEVRSDIKAKREQKKK